MTKSTQPPQTSEQFEQAASQQQPANKQLITPLLSKLDELGKLVDEQNHHLLTSSQALHQISPSFLTNFTIEQLEEQAANFINQKLLECKLMDRIANVNQEVERLLNKIKFFQAPTSYVTGFFDYSFSSQDRQNWTQIESLLASIYDADNGYLKELQDIFLFNVNGQQLAHLVDKEQLTLTEELFLRNLLIDSYLVVFRQLVLPFYNVDDQILVNFKKERTRQLEQMLGGEVTNEQALIAANNEVALLRKQIANLEANSSLRSGQTRGQLQQRFAANQQQATVYNRQLNVGSVVLGSVETFRYLSSAVGHKTGIEVLKKVGTIGAEAGGFIARCLPFVSTAVETVTQINANRSFYNYEKRLKIVEILDYLKVNMLIQEQRVNDYERSNIKRRLYEELINQQELTNQALGRTTDDLITSRGKQARVDEKLTEVNITCKETVLAIHSQIAGDYEEKILQKQSLLISKEEEIAVKEVLVVTLNGKVSDLEQEVLSSESKLITNNEKLQELGLSLKTTHEDLEITRRNLTIEQQISIRKEKSLQKLMNGDYHAVLSCQLDYANEQRAQLGLVINSQREEIVGLRESLLNGDLKEENNQVKEENEQLKALNQHLDGKLQGVKVEREQLLKITTVLRGQAEELSKKLVLADNECLKLQRNVQSSEELFTYELAKNRQQREFKSKYDLLLLERDKILTDLRNANSKQQSTQQLLATQEVKVEKLETKYQQQVEVNLDLAIKYEQQKQSFILANWSWVSVFKSVFILLSILVGCRVSWPLFALFFKEKEKGTKEGELQVEKNRKQKTTTP